MPYNVSPQRIAVIVPKYRTWVWQRRIIDAIHPNYRIDIFTSAKKPRYPIALRIWLHFEACLFGELDLVKSAVIRARPWPQGNISDYSLVLNLSEVPIENTTAHILEPRYEGNLDSLNLISVLLSKKNPHISFHDTNNPEPITASYLAIQDRVVLSRGLQNSFARLQFLAERAITHLNENTRAAIIPVISTRPIRFSSIVFSVFLARFFIDKSFVRFFRQFQNEEHWFVALIKLKGWKLSRDIPLQDLMILPDDRRRFYADPFLFSKNGQKWLFVEEYDYKTRKGFISCTQVNNLDKVSIFKPVLTRPYHLSYPLVFGHENEIYMIPETAKNRTVQLFRAKAFPFEWALTRILLEDLALHDATVVFYQGIWWMFGAIAHEGGSAQDELAIFYSPALDGPWKAHKLNPVKSDCRSVRPAGHFLKRDGRLMRPAQDCESGYGSALVWLEIEELTFERFREREITRWTGQNELRADGIHTFNCDDELGTFDFRRGVTKRLV